MRGVKTAQRPSTVTLGIRVASAHNRRKYSVFGGSRPAKCVAEMKYYLWRSLTVWQTPKAVKARHVAKVA